MAMDVWKGMQGYHAVHAYDSGRGLIANGSEQRE